MKQVYQSEDGKIFSTAAECTAHENQNIITLYYRYTPTGIKGTTTICYSVNIPKLYEQFSDALFREFISKIVGPEIIRSFSSPNLTTPHLTQSYSIEKITAVEYQTAITQKELNYNTSTGALHGNSPTSWIDKLFFVPSVNASNLEEMMKPHSNWNSSCTTPIKALTTEDLKAFGYTDCIAALTTDNLKSFTTNNKQYKDKINKPETWLLKKTIKIRDLL